MSDVSEFDGARGPNGIYLKPVDALTATDALRLDYRAGVRDPAAPHDPHAWAGTDKNFYEQQAIVEAKQRGE